MDAQPNIDTCSQTKLSHLTHSFSGKTLGCYPGYVRALLNVKWAAARANLELGQIDAEACDQLIDSCDMLLVSENANLFIVDVFQGGGAVGINTNVNEILSQVSGVDVARVNASQSTADVCATAIRIALFEQAHDTCSKLAQVEQTLTAKAGTFSEIRTIARTCLRDASSTTLGATFQAYADVVGRRLTQLREAAKLFTQVNLGGTVFGSTEGAADGFGARAIEFLSGRYPFPISQRQNLYDAAQNADDIGLVGHQIALLAEVLIKLCKDLRLLFSGPRAGFGEIILPPVIRGSTFYSNKNNPTIPETMLQCCFDILGKQRTIQACLEHAELQLNVFEPMAGICLYDALARLSRCLTLFDQHCLQGIAADKARCEQLLLEFNLQAASGRSKR